MMALWWIKGVQRESDEAIAYLLEADTEAMARSKADRHGIEVGSVTSFEGAAELHAIRAELVQVHRELSTLRKGVIRRRNRLRDKPVWTIAIGVFLGLLAFVVITIGIAMAAGISIGRAS